MVKELSAHTNEIMLEGKSRRVTVMFCDLRNFTAMSEQLKPQEDQVQRAVQASFEMYRALGELASHYGKEAANAIALFRELAHKYPDQTY